VGKYQIHQGYRKDKSKLSQFVFAFLGFFLALGGGVLYFNPGAISANDTVTQSVPAQNSQADPTEQPKITAPMPWPGYGRAAYGVKDDGVLAASQSEDQPVPVASLAKVITALAILEKKPLEPGQQGPMITLNEQDVASYSEHMGRNGSVVPVVAGEQITQYQAMQAMLMSSSNNLSDSLVRWAFGSTEAYTIYANEMTKRHGLNKTNIADASGFSAQTTSTAGDMVQFGILYMQNPVLRQIAIEPHANIPVAGLIPNYNAALNRDSLIGIKVGNTDEAGRCFMLADIRRKADGTEILAVTVVLGAPHIQNAMQDAQKIITAGNQGYDRIH
jgi:serine-type D-Ala-D-Ala carboxypeptidase (penicillin-binding protein 5/6)